MADATSSRERVARLGRGLVGRVRRTGSQAQAAGAPAPHAWDAGTSRWGWGKPPHAALALALAAGSDLFSEQLDRIRHYGADLAAISVDEEDDSEPYWGNSWFTGLAAASLYTYVRERRPHHYV